MTWQTADTAPKDGSRILTCYGAERVMTARGVEVLMNEDSHQIYQWQDDGWFNGEFVEQEDGDGPPFEFWMPLPPVPWR